MINRIILLVILAFEGLGGILGGILLVIAPDGRFLGMSIKIMHGFFPNFFIPGLVLSTLGIVTLCAFIAVINKTSISWLLTVLSLGSFVIWFVVEIAILREILWLHIVSGVPVLLGIWMAFSLIYKFEIKERNIILLRTIHTAFAIYFLYCIGYIYYSGITLQINVFVYIAIFSIAIEGFLVFILNHGHCPLAPLQKKINDPVPFFNLFLPDYLAKKAIVFFTLLAIVGILLLISRMLIK